MKGLLSPLSVKRLPKKHWWNLRKYELLAPLAYATKCGLIVVAPEGFITDFATWFKPRGRYEIPAVLHDALYDVLAGRSFADRIFKEAMTRACCGRARINVMYYGVRCFGWVPYYYKWIKRYMEANNG